MGAFCFLSNLFRFFGLNTVSDAMKQTEPTYSLAYPRRTLRRKILRTIGRGIIRLLTRTTIEGLENIPASGPIILAGNHAGYIEPVLMAVFPKRIAEPIGAGDLPFEGGIDLIVDYYGFIPVNRGSLDRKAMSQAMDVLRQGGVIGIFPEGGTWAPGKMAPQIGISLLSQRTGAKVVPIGFSGLQGSLSKVLKLKRPKLTMRVGEPIPAMPATEGGVDKARLVEYSQQVLDAIYGLVTDDERALIPTDESYKLWVEDEKHGKFELEGGSALANFLHSPVLLESLKGNLKLPIQALYGLKAKVSGSEMRRALQAILDYLVVNPAFFTYRLGREVGEQVAEGIRALRELLDRAGRDDLPLRLRTRAVTTFEGGRQEVNEKSFLIEPGV